MRKGNSQRSGQKKPENNQPDTNDQNEMNAETMEARALPNDGREELYNFFLDSESPRLGATVPELVNNEDQVKNVIQSARENKEIVRVFGSAHSIGPAVGDTENTPNERLIRLSGELRSFTVLSDEGGTKIVKVGGGCYLGQNPLDKDSTMANSVNVQLENIDCAIPILGGITHQSIAGFTMTGSAGGSVAHGFEDIIKEIHFIDGKGRSQVAVKGTDLFNRGRSIFWSLRDHNLHVLEVKTPSFKVGGFEQTVSEADSVLAVDQNTGTSKLQETLENTEYFRLLWFPQKYAQRVTEWSGHRSESNEIIPYKNVLGNPWVAGAAAMALKSMHWLLTNRPGEDTYKFIGDALKIFTFKNPTEFNDVWYKTIPMDEQTPCDTIFRTEFTELWFPMEETEHVMSILRVLYEDQQVAGNYACELYAAKSSPFWMSPAHNRNVFRCDPFWFYHQKGDPREYFDHFWKVLMEVDGVRLHWGKLLPYSGGTYGGTTYDVAFMKKSYPKMDDWLALRAEYDPDQIYLTEYWRKLFGIETIPAQK
ncbi:D-arabinono-1,4-lactone oxidase [Apostichopus japonicus]|uniref:D-arabinono-1,4-lactone oxidase n=1 Tax=Stichopus japonicus TaxID=307972 RepID=A0A2G8KT10_STIJA|nr:D-arabinono-1,4-lactone oxidase [Apostichopus japonicus]